MNAIRLHQLEGFYYVGITGGYARAAAAMPYPITEPAVYQQVRKLERELGVSLVIQQKKPRKTVLTPAGRRLHDFVAPFFRGLPDLAESLRRGEASRLVIAVEGALVRELIARAVAQLRAKHPEVEVHVAERKAHEVIELVRAGDAELGIATLGLASGPIEETPLFTVRVALCVPPGHALEKLERTPLPGDLDGVPLCVYERGNPGRAILDAAFQQVGVRLRIAAEASSFETLRALVSAGVAPAFVPVVEADRKNGHKKRRAEEDACHTYDVTGLLPGEPVRFGLVRRARAPRSPAVRELEELLRATRL